MFMSLKKSKQLLGLPLSTVFDPPGLSGTVRWSRLLLKDDVSSLDKEFKNPLSDTAMLSPQAPWLHGSGGAGGWSRTAHGAHCPTSSAADGPFPTSVQDCRSLEKEQDEPLGVFTAFSREENEHDFSLRLGDDEGACCTAYFAQIK